MVKTYLEKNIKAAQDKLAFVLASDGYKSLTTKQKLVADNILNTIITSEFLTCWKSNRTLSDETGIPLTTVNQARLKLAKLDLITIHAMPNGKRTNKKYYLTLKDMKFPRLEYKFKHKTSARKHMANFLADGSLQSISKIEKLHDLTALKKEVAMLKAIDRYYCYTTDRLDAFSALYTGKKSNKKQKTLKVNNSFSSKIVNTASTASDTKKARIQTLLPLARNLTALGRALEASGFAVVPYCVDNLSKHLYGFGDLRNKSSFDRIETLDKVIGSHFVSNSDEWVSTFFGGLKALQDLEKKGVELGYYQEIMLSKTKQNHGGATLYNGVGVEMPRGMVCIDIDDALLYKDIKALVPDGYWTKTRRGYHCFVWDRTNILKGFKLKGVDILRGKQKVIFSAWDKKDFSEIYEYISGDLQNIGHLRADFKSYICGTDTEDLIEISSNDVGEQPVQTRKAFGFQLPEVIIKSERNNTLYKFGRSLMGKGYDTDYVECAIRTVNDNSVYMPEPLEQSELKGLIKSATKEKDRKGFVRHHAIASR